MTATGMSMTARDQSLDRLVTWRRALLGTTTSSPWAVRSLVTRRVSSSTVPVIPVVWPGTDSRITSPKANWCSAKRKKPASRSPTICWAPKPEADADHRGRGHQGGERDAQPVEGQDGGDEVGQGDHRPLHRLADRPGPLEALGGHRARLDLAPGSGCRSSGAGAPRPSGRTGRRGRLRARARRPGAGGSGTRCGGCPEITIDRRTRSRPAARRRAGRPDPTPAGPGDAVSRAVAVRPTVLSAPGHRLGPGDRHRPPRHHPEGNTTCSTT